MDERNGSFVHFNIKCSPPHFALRKVGYLLIKLKCYILYDNNYLLTNFSFLFCGRYFSYVLLPFLQTTPP